MTEYASCCLKLVLLMGKNIFEPRLLYEILVPFVGGTPQSFLYGSPPTRSHSRMTKTYPTKCTQRHHFNPMYSLFITDMFINWIYLE